MRSARLFLYDLGGLNMGSVNFIWNLTKNYFTFGLIGLTVSDRYASIVPVGGISMSPTFNPRDGSSMRSLTRDFVIVEKLCLEKYKFSLGDVVVFSALVGGSDTGVATILESPSNTSFTNLMRIFNDISFTDFQRNLVHRSPMTSAIKKLPGIEFMLLHPTQNSPTNHKEKNIKRITALPGDLVSTPYYDAVVIPEGHCWVEGDNQAWSLDSRSFGPIPLGLVCGRVTHVVWPPHRVGKVERMTPKSLTPF